MHLKPRPQRHTAQHAGGAARPRPPGPDLPWEAHAAASPSLGLPLPRPLTPGPRACPPLAPGAPSGVLMEEERQQLAPPGQGSRGMAGTWLPKGAPLPLVTLLCSPGGESPGLQGQSRCAWKGSGNTDWSRTTVNDRTLPSPSRCSGGNGVRPSVPRLPAPAVR